MARGSIVKTGPSSYRVRVEIAPSNGKRRWATKVLGSKKEAEKFRTEVLSKIDSGYYVNSGTLTFDTLCDRYLDARASQLDPTTLNWYRRNLRDHVRPTLGPLKVSTIKPLHIQSVLDAARDVSRRKSRRGQALAASSRRNLLNAMGAVFTWAESMELIARNPVKRLIAPKVLPREYPQFDSETLTSVVSAISGTEFEVLALFALFTGARRGEVAALRWQDVDLPQGRFSIRRSAAILDGEQIYKSPKSVRSRRTVALPPSLVDLLGRHKKAQARRYDRIGMALPNKDTPVFDRENGEPWNVNELSRRWSRLVRRNKLPHIRLHDLRHAFASLSHDAGAPIHSIAETMGHSSIGVTSATYVHLFDDAKRQRAEKLDEHINSKIRDRIVTPSPSESSETA